MTDYDIIVTKGNKRQHGLLGAVRNPTIFGVEADLENGERVSLSNRDFDYLAERAESTWNVEYGTCWVFEK